jgi:hypothetical protein
MGKTSRFAHKRHWIPVGNNAVKTQRKRMLTLNRMND